MEVETAVEGDTEEDNNEENNDGNNANEGECEEVVMETTVRDNTEGERITVSVSHVGLAEGLRALEKP